LSPLACRLASAFYALNFSVPVANALSGFMPQTWGMVFLFIFLPFFLRSTTHIERNRMLISAGVTSALLLFSYPEILPFALVAAGISFLYRLGFGRLRFKDAVISFLGIGLITVILTPVAAVKLPAAMAIQISAVVGWDVKFNLWDYLSMLAGYRSFFQGGASPFFHFLAILTAALTFFALLAGPRRVRRQVVPLLLIFLLALAWFTLFVVNPWNPNERGQPWSTYKVVTYIFFLFAPLYGLGLAMLWKKGGWIRLGATGLLGIYIALFPAFILKGAKASSAGMRFFTGVQGNPIAEYKRIRLVLSDLPPETPVNLVFPPEALRHRQMTAYFLRRPVIADWMDDVYIWPHLSPDCRSLPIDFSFPILAYKPFTQKRTVANLVLDRCSQIIIRMGSGWHGHEQDQQHWWRWLEREGEVVLSLAQNSRVTLHAEIAIIGAPQRTITIRVLGRPELSILRTLAESWFVPLAPIEFNLPQGTHKILFSADGPVARMGQDPRKVSMGVRDLSSIAISTLGR
jgi:hypothetical protein